MIENRIPAIWTGMYAELPLHTALETLSDQGWKSFEISTEHLCEIEAATKSDTMINLALEVCETYDLMTLQGHASLTANVAHRDKARRDRDIKQLKVHMDIASLLGVNCIVIHPGCFNGVTTGQERNKMIQYNIEAFRDLGNYAAGLNMKIGLENLPIRVYASSAELLELIDRIDHDAIGVTFDSSHAMMTPGIDIPAAIRDFGDLLVCTHLSDNDGSGDQHKTPGTGKIDWPELVEALSDINYTGLINLEIPGERHPIARMKALKSAHALQVADLLIEMAVEKDV